MAVKRYLLDTNHAGTLLHESASLWNRVGNLDGEQCGLCMPCVGELWFMVLNSGRVRTNRGKLEALLRQFVIWPFDANAAIEFGTLRVELRKAGKPIPTFDVLIAAIARVNDLVLPTADHHFQVVDGLKIENWLG